ncbi:MAG: CvpA family protein [Ignavibacteriae bacterium]|nr:CvpA family protein [Ignavibacteriota bacterium]
MNTIDIITAAIIITIAYLGFRRGFLVSVFSLISIIIGIVLATKFHSGIALVMQKVIKDEKTLNVISFLSIFFTVYLTGIFVANKLSKISSLTKSIDRILGAVLGALKGMLAASLILIFIRSLGIFGESEIKSSYLFPYVSNFAPDTFDAVSKLLPFNRKTFDDLNSFLKTDTQNKK